MWFTLGLPNPLDPGRELMPTPALLASQAPDQLGPDQLRR